MAESTHWAFPSPLQPNAAEAAFDLPRAFDAVVRLAARIPDDAFTAPILGTEREGNGVVIRDNGLIVTVGYLITEAHAIWITTNDGRGAPRHRSGRTVRRRGGRVGRGSEPDGDCCSCK